MKIVLTTRRSDVRAVATRSDGEALSVSTKRREQAPHDSQRLPLLSGVGPTVLELIRDPHFDGIALESSQRRFFIKLVNLLVGQILEAGE